MEENNNVVEETTKTEQPVVDEKVEKIKVKKRRPSKKLTEDVVKVDLTKPVGEEVTKVDLTKKEDNADQEQETTDVVADEQAPALQEVVEEIPQGEETVQAEQPVAEVEEVNETAELPENIQKLMQFMEETGGDINDYVALNRNVDELDGQDALIEYYKKTKPHLTYDEINFLLEDNFKYDEEVDEEVDVRRKKLALKEQVAEAKAYLDGQKSKYYEEIKARDKRLTPEQQKAMDFFNRYNSEQEQTEKNHKVFLNKTNQVFNKDFKGFEYNVGDKRFRLNINDLAQVKETQSDANNFFKKFLNENNVINDAHSYHKSIYTAMNPDVIAQHFYEQGKADAIKETVARDKNIQVNPRQTQGETTVGGFKFKVLGDTTDSLKLKMRKRK
jgi:hypothetical protein